MIYIKKICVVGAGNIGLASAIEFSQNENFKVTLLTNKASTLSKKWIYYDIDSETSFTNKEILITSDYNQALKDADLVMVTLPSFLTEEFMAKMNSFNPKIILFAPGYGNKEKYCNELIKKGCIILGFDRSPYISRIQNETTVFVSKKQKIRLGIIGNRDYEEIKSLISNLFKFEVEVLPNYLTVTLTPSNPILHTSRLFAIFENKKIDYIFPQIIKFYSDWNNHSSDIMIKMDNELQNICKKIEKQENIDLSKVIPLTIHYESQTVEEMTNKLSNIKSFKNINAPMLQCENGFKIDLSSRYFKEDFEFGLKIIQEYAKKYQVETPIIDTVMSWYNDIK